MGKSNNVHNQLKKVHKIENNLNKSFKEDEIKILKNINNYFTDNFIKFFSSFTKNSVGLVSHNITIDSYDSNIKIVKNLRCINLIEILPEKYQSFIIFSYEFLSITIDILFGGRGDFIEKTPRIKDITSTESLINKKIIEFITSSLSEIYTKFFSLEIKYIHTKTFFDLKKSNFDINAMFIINSFTFNINNTEVFFNILIPISILKHINNKIAPLKSTKNKNICIDKNIENRISLNDIYNVEINVASKIIGISIPYDKIYNLSVGDVLPMKKPEKITGFIEEKAIFSGKYKIFNEQCVVFVEDFIDSIESNQEKEYFNE